MPQPRGCDPIDRDSGLAISPDPLAHRLPAEPGWLYLIARATADPLSRETNKGNKRLLSHGKHRYLLSLKRSGEHHAGRRASVRKQFLDQVFQLFHGRKYYLQEKGIASGQVIALLNRIEGG